MHDGIWKGYIHPFGEKWYENMLGKETNLGSKVSRWIAFGFYMVILGMICLVWKKPELYGYSLYGKTIGIIGIGKIGSYVANIAKGFNLKVLATAEKIDNQRKVLFKKQGIELVALDNLLEFSDIVSLHVPLKKNTK